jgi:DNA-binding CsgD family transcriptional regulator
MLIGRNLELQKLDELLKAAKGSTSGALLLRGEPGIGKSALVAYALECAGDFRTIVCRAIESESEIPFSGLAELLGPALKHLDAIPQPQADALRGVLALGPPVAGDRFAVYAATLSLLAAAAEEGPMLVAVDDVQWLDRASAEALLFTVRRLGAEGIAIILVCRVGEPSVFDDSGLEELVVGGLGKRDIGTLLESRGVHVADEVARKLHRATAGNPLAVLEISALLSHGQLAGIEPLGDPLPAGRASVERAFLQRVVDLPLEARRALVVAAAADSEDMAPIAGAMKAMGIEPVRLEAAEDRGLIDLEGHLVVFAHPLIRSCIYHAADPSERRAAHRALASSLHERGSPSDSDRAAWHIAAAAVEPDETVAGALEKVALGARERSGYAAAARAFERAGELSPAAGDRAQRFLEAADVALLAGQTARASALLEKALEAATDPMLLARIEYLRGRTEVWQGRTETAFRILVVGASRYRETDPVTACLMLVEATMACGMRGDIEAAVATGERAWRAARALGGPPEIAAAVLYAASLMLKGFTARASDVLAEVAQPDEAYVSATSDLFSPSMAARIHAWMERYDEALRLGALVIEVARGTGTVGALPMALATQADTEFDVGNWSAAYAHAMEAIDLGRATGQQSFLSYCLAVAAKVEAARGLAKDCREHIKEAVTLVTFGGESSVSTYSGAALGALELGLGRYRRAADELRKVAKRLARINLRNPGVVRWAPDLVEALAHVGSHDEAWKVLDTLQPQAERVGTPWAKAVVARCRGIIVEGGFDSHFETALKTHQLDVLPFERARTELAYGERLRRSRRRGEARSHLREALETFERLGATPWEMKARAELRATGESARPRNVAMAQDLTPQEHTIARAVAQGATNKEVAAALFLSPKTVESHLSRIYSKLGVRSRTELTRQLVTQTRTPPNHR